MAAAASVAATLALTGCGAAGGAGGGGHGASPFQAAISGYYRGLANHDATTVCAEVTPTFWQAMAGQLNASLAASGGTRLAGGSCLDGLRYVFARLRTPGSPNRLHLTVRDVSVHGAVASAIVTDGPTRQPARFVRSAGGHWQLDCCTGAQLGQLPRTRYRVPSVSMEPTLRPGEIVTADNSALRARPPSLGEIVTLHPPAGAACPDLRQGAVSHQPCGAPAQSGSAEVVIKRVVGVPGDRIALVGGHVIRNGLVEHEPYILACGGALCDFPKPIVVPPGTYYVLGDNRGDSLDSRVYGPVRRTWVLGLVQR